MNAPLIRVQDLHYAYPIDGDRPLPALDGISLEIAEGEYLAVLGHNGSGKSTLARCLNGLLRPTQGDVWVTGLNTQDAAALIRIRSTVGIVFQNPDNQFVSTVVEEEVAFGPENLGLPQPEIAARVAQALKVTGLDDARQRNPRNLSAGQKARLAIAGILAMQPRCLVLDESTVFLDPQARRAVLAIVQHLHRQGITVVTITHNMAEAALAHRVLVLEAGRIAMLGKPGEVFGRADELERLGLELPAAAQIARHLRRRGIPLAQRVLTAEQLVQAALSMAEAAR